MKPERMGLWMLLSSSLVSLLVLSCDGRPRSFEQARATTASQKLISDQHHGGGTVGLVFLPPIVSPPAQYGDFIPGLPVSVRIDELNQDMTTMRTLATFTTDGGPHRERLRIHYQNAPCDRDDTDRDTDPVGYYYARWFTNDAHLTPSAHYRIRVLVPAKGGNARELGFSDVDVATNMHAYRAVDTQQFTPLLNLTTLRIKFRIDRPAVDQDHDGIYDWLDNCPSIANPDQKDSLKNGVGDKCRCAHVSCKPADSCHVVGECRPESGTCTDPVASDGTTCPMPQATATCTGGQCQFVACLPGYADCDGDLGDGCETPTTTTDNCGACGVVCSAGPNSTPACRQGTCALSCSGGYADCDDDLANGCEQPTGTDPANCGRCGHACVSHEGCVSGGCTTLTCQGRYGNCDQDAANGCEADLTTDAKNCGNCGTACNVPNATPTCIGGACVIESCNVGYGDCNQTPADGCEMDITLDPRNCGECGHTCAFPNASAACSQATCVKTACNPGYADCDGLETTGCEVDLRSTQEHCGACGNACVRPNASSACVSGTCVLGSCNASYADCNGDGSDGCEMNLSTNAANCGACAAACPSGPHSSPVCAAAKCDLVCDAGYANCDGDPSNGCETYVQDQCGVCSCSVPNAVSECLDGVCTFSVCQPGFGDCDGIAANGCEVNLAQSCGICPPGCDDGDQCTDDTCDPTKGCVHARTKDPMWQYQCSGTDPCAFGSCQGTLESYSCTYAKVPDGTSCRPRLNGGGPEDYCYNPGTCQDGLCRDATPLVCPTRLCYDTYCLRPFGVCMSTLLAASQCCPASTRECYTSTFNAATGLCEETPSMAQGPCHVGGPCMQTGTCQLGYCHNAWLPLPPGIGCSNGNPCDGDETCDGYGSCFSGSAPAEGTACGVGLTCQNQVCQ